MSFPTMTPVPSTEDPANFAAYMDAFLAKFPTWATEATRLAVAMTLNATTANSTTSLTIGTGEQSLTVDVSKSYEPGMSVKIAYTTDPTNWMFGDVKTYNSTTGALVVTVISILGSGTQAVWTVSLSGPAMSGGAVTEMPVGGGATLGPVWTEATGTGAPVRATSPTLVTPALGTPASGDLSNCTNAGGIVTTSVEDEAEIALDTGKTGRGWAMAGDNEEFIQFRFTAAGVVAIISNSANAINTDTDGFLCVYDAGAGIAIKNRLGATKNIRYIVNYS